MSETAPDEVSVVDLEVRDGAAVVTMRRPPVNALDTTLVGGLERALDAIDADPSVRVILLTSAGTKAFCAGADIDLMVEDRSVMRALVDRIRAVIDRIEAHPVPSIAALGVSATGGGLELALGCDLRVTGEGVRLGFPEVKLGLIPGAGGTQRIAAIAGRAVAARMVLEGELVTGAEAFALGIVQHVVADGDVDAYAHSLAAKLGAYPADALRGAKRCLALAPSAAGFAAELEVTEHLYESAETKELLDEFLRRRRSR